MDLPTFAKGLTARATELLPEWFPDGKWVGKEFQIGSVAGEPGRSLSVNSLTGQWADFAAPQHKGGDLVSLYAAKEGIGQGEAAKRLGWTNGGAAPEPARKALEASASPIPADAPPLPAVAGLTEPVAVYLYNDLLRIARYEPGRNGKKKEFLPWTWRAGKWSAKHLPAPRPLFGLEELADKPVLLVEGEKACLAARAMVGRIYTVLTWPGGAEGVGKADWSPLYGRAVDIWPDADDAGNKAANAIAAILAPHLVERVRIFSQEGQPKGWDLADAQSEGWTYKQVAAHARRDGEAHIRTIERVKPAESVTVTPRQDMQALGLASSGSGPFATEANVAKILQFHPQFAGKLWIDEFAQELMVGDAICERVDNIQAMIYIQENLLMPKLTLGVVERAALYVGAKCKRNPVKEWLDPLIWDGTDRLDSLMSDGFGAAHNEYTAAVGRCWLVSLIARIYSPGCQADYMPVFEGSQGVKKSTAMRTLGGKWFIENHADPIRNDKDFLQGIQGHFLIEMPEMHNISGKGSTGIAKIKGLITNRVDNYREPYGVKVRPYPRQCVFCGTTNEDTWNPDPTGGRRFWPIQCGAISIDYLTDNREQLFAEAVARFKRSEQWWDIPELQAKEEQEARRERHVWEDLVLEYLSRKTGPVTIADVLTDSRINKEPGQWTQRDSNSVAAILRANGYVKKRSNEGTRPYLYVKSIGGRVPAATELHSIEQEF